MNWIVFAILAFSGCVMTSPKPLLQADYSLILPYTFALEDRAQMARPYVARYQAGDKTLLYVASEHFSIDTYPNIYEHPTLLTIDALFKEFKPEVVVVEGINTGDELSPKSFFKHADGCIVRKYRGCGESSFAVNLAREAGVEFISGEPKSDVIEKELLNDGYVQDDIHNFYIVRQIPQYKRQGDLDKQKFSQEFKAWYAKHMPRPKNYLHINSNDCAPHSGPDASYVQIVSSKIGRIRDRAVVNTIAKMLNTYSRVLVIYGGSHLLTQEPALNAMLGNATYFQIAPVIK